MSRIYYKQHEGYRETIQHGISAVRAFDRGVSFGTGSREDRVKKLKDELAQADAIVVGAGAGLSTAAGVTYSGERFERYFGDFAERCGL